MSVNQRNYSPVIIIGAPRSGTNMLRDILSSLPGMATWPCDEINYIWRYGNVSWPSDEIPPERCTPSIAAYIQRQFAAVAKRYEADIVIEKTCANSLRVPFVESSVPDARYIYIYRDGIDAVGSARLRWTAQLDIPYILRKARYVPLIDMPYYFLRFIWSQAFRLISPEKRLASWGPVLSDMQTILGRHSLNEICAIQWQRCVDNAEAALSALSEERVVRVCYENFVRSPEAELERLLCFLGREVQPDRVRQAVERVSAASLGKGRESLGNEEVARLESLIAGSLRRYGYL